MKTLRVLLASFCITSCSTLPPVDCTFSDAEIAVIRASVRDFLKAEWGDVYAYYARDSAVTDIFEEVDGVCGVFVMPTNNAPDGSSILHGEAIVYFHPESLEPFEVRSVVW